MNDIINSEKNFLSYNLYLYTSNNFINFVYFSGDLKNGNLSVTLADKYDFKASSKAGFNGIVGLINDFGYANQELGIISNYYVIAKFDYCIN